MLVTEDEGAAQVDVAAYGPRSQNPSRRAFLRTVMIGLPATGLLIACHTRPANVTAPIFFRPDEADFINAAVKRLIPADELGPGAYEADVARFIDLQLAGAYGRAERWYMQGPWPTGTDSQGFQLKYTPAQIYRLAIADTDAYCRQNYGSAFAHLVTGQQDWVLHALEKGKIKFSSLPAKTFFNLLWQNTMEGFLADPAYAGNRDFIGWKLIGFPGPRYNYVQEIEQYGRPYAQPFVSLVGRNPDNRSTGEG